MASKEACLLPLPSRSTSMQVVAGLERLLLLVVAGASRGATQIEEVAQMSVNAATIDLIRLPLAKSKGKRLDYFLTRAFGCWHSNMGRPITAVGETYRACLDCGVVASLMRRAGR